MLGLTLDFTFAETDPTKLDDVTKIPRMLIVIFHSYKLQKQKVIESRPTQDRFREFRSTFAHYSPPE